MPKRVQSTPTIADVARECGAGSMTVSRVINGHKHVSPEMARRVRAAIAKLNYKPNEAARILKGQASRTIGFIVPNLSDTFFANCAHAVQQLAAKHGYTTLLFACEGEKNTESEELSLIRSRNVAGVLIAPTSRASVAGLEELRRNGVPVVMLDRTFDGLDAGEVVVENHGGACKAVNHLIEHGHRQILCVGYDSEYNSIGQRIAGYKETMLVAGLKPQFLLVKRDAEIAPQIVKRLLSAKPPSALFSLNNITTAALLQALQKENIQIPQCVAIIGFDDFELAPLLAVPLTAIRQPAAELGRSATRMLLEWIRSGSAVGPFNPKIVLPTELVVRRSCGCQPPPKIATFMH